MSGFIQRQSSDGQLIKLVGNYPTQIIEKFQQELQTKDIKDRKQEEIHKMNQTPIKKNSINQQTLLNQDYNVQDFKYESPKKFTISQYSSPKKKTQIKVFDISININQKDDYVKQSENVKMIKNVLGDQFEDQNYLHSIQFFMLKKNLNSKQNVLNQMLHNLRSRNQVIQQTISNFYEQKNQQPYNNIIYQIRLNCLDDDKKSIQPRMSFSTSSLTDFFKSDTKEQLYKLDHKQKAYQHEFKLEPQKLDRQFEKQDFKFKVDDDLRINKDYVIKTPLQTNKVIQDLNQTIETNKKIRAKSYQCLSQKQNFKTFQQQVQQKYNEFDKLMTNYKYSFINKTEEIKQITNYSNKFIVKKPVSDRESVEAKNSKSQKTLNYQHSINNFNKLVDKIIDNNESPIKGFEITHQHAKNNSLFKITTKYLDIFQNTLSSKQSFDQQIFQYNQNYQKKSKIKQLFFQNKDQKTNIRQPIFFQSNNIDGFSKIKFSKNN